MTWKIAAIAVIIFVVAFLWVLIVWAGAAWGHQAQTGWWYDPSCCAGNDCRELKSSEVKVGRGVVQIRNGELEECGWIEVPISSRKIRPSGDKKWHACFQNDYRGKRCDDRCLYRPAPTGV